MPNSGSAIEVKMRTMIGAPGMMAIALKMPRTMKYRRRNLPPRRGSAEGPPEAAGTWSWACIEAGCGRAPKRRLSGSDGCGHGKEGLTPAVAEAQAGGVRRVCRPNISGGAAPLPADSRHVTVLPGLDVGKDSRDIIRELEADGWYHIGTTGSHWHFKHPVKRRKVTVPHPRRDLHPKTVRSIYRQAALPEKR